MTARLVVSILLVRRREVCVTCAWRERDVTGWMRDDWHNNLYHRFRLKYEIFVFNLLSRIVFVRLKRIIKVHFKYLDRDNCIYWPRVIIYTMCNYNFGKIWRWKHFLFNYLFHRNTIFRLIKYIWISCVLNTTTAQMRISKLVHYNRVNAPTADHMSVTKIYFLACVFTGQSLAHGAFIPPESHQLSVLGQYQLT